MNRITARFFLIVVFPVFLFFGKDNLSAQPVTARPDTENGIRQLFKNPDKVLWVKFFQGRLDELNDVLISVGSDGRELRGQLTYLESGTQFRLEGSLTGADFALRELNLKGELTGKLIGRFEKNGLRAEWVNATASLVMRLDATEQKIADHTLTDCASGKWLRRFEAMQNGQVVELFLARLAGGQLTGSVWLPNEKTTAMLFGRIDPATSEFNLILKKSGGKETGCLKGKMEGSGSSQPASLTIDGNSKSLIFRQIEQFSPGCSEWADYSTSYDVLFPQTRNQDVNRWFSKRAAEWMSACRKQHENHPPAQIPANRANFRATGWADILVWDERLVCGILHFQHPSDPILTTDESFNFDLETGKKVEQADLFISNFDWVNWLEPVLQKEKMTLADAPDSDEFIKKWVTSEPFSYWTIRREGLAFSTRFSPLHGQPTVVVPWSQLRPYLKKESVVGAFVK